MINNKVALITGITGQDGSFLAELLLSKGYAVHGIARTASTPQTKSRISHLLNQITVHNADLTDGSRLAQIIATVEPDEVYNLAAQSHVHISFKQPEYTMQVDALSTLKLLEIIRNQIQISKKIIKFYQAGSSEMFGSTAPPQNEQTPFHPRSPYACAKVYSHMQTINYRESYGMFSANGILFNHESERRGEEFVTRKITRAATRIKLGLQRELKLGNLNAKRDWGFAGDYVEAMWMMLQHDQPDDYVVATGESHTVQEFCEITFGLLNLDYKKYVKIDPEFFRPAEVDYLLGDSTKIRTKLLWKPKVSFQQLIERMVMSDLQLAKAEMENAPALIENA